MKNSANNRESGVALVVTMIVLAVMAVVAVAFMQGAGTDRSAANSLVANYQARLAAEAGARCVALGVSRMLGVGGNPANTTRGYHDAVTVWQNIGGNETNEATVFYVRAVRTNTEYGARPEEFGAAVRIMAQPLVSGGTMVPAEQVGSILPFRTNDPSMVNLNATNEFAPEPWIGYRSSGNVGAPVMAARWVYISRDGGPTNTTNPPIARYAFWAEDESFKANLNVLTNDDRGTNVGLGPEQATIDGPLSASSLLRNLVSGTASMLEAREDEDFEDGGFASTGAGALALGLQGTTNAAAFRFLTTVHSAGLDLSRGGFKRFNINTVTNGITGPGDAANIRTSLDRIIAAITNSNSVPNFGQRFYRLRNDAAGINTNAVSTNHAAIYLNKIAANLLDYVDDNDQPTVINVPTNSLNFTNNLDFTIRTGRPTNGILPLGEGTSGINPIAAMGVENVPRLQEYAIHLRVRSMKWDEDDDSFGFVFNTNQGAVNPTKAEYVVWLDHYFEFWNPGTRDYTNSPDAFLKIFDQPAWGPGVGGGVVTGPPRGGGSIVTNNRTTSDIPLIDSILGTPVVFPAGEVTVLTTAPWNAPGVGNTMNAGADPANFLVVTSNPLGLVSLKVPDADRIFKGTTSSIRTTNYSYQSAAINGGPDFGYNRLFEVQMQFGRPGGTDNTDYASGVLIGNDQGIIESHVGLPIGVLGGGSKFSAIVESSWNRNDLDHVPGNIPNGHVDNVRGGGLAGNFSSGASTARTKPNSKEGDPRSLLEQLEMNILSGVAFSDPSRFDDTRFYNSIGPGGSSAGVFAQNTFGRPNINYVRPTNWTDYSSINPGASNAPLFVRNGPMQSIGELGHITDPARPYITSGSVPVLARGGGRTLRVGQSELTNFGGTNIAWYDGNQTNASRTWTSWRLADIFTTKSELSTPGLINPNGILRDGGAAMRAALHGLRFLPSPDGSTNTAGRPVNATNVVNAMLSRITNTTGSGLPAGALNALWERGEISELPLFNTGNSLASVNMQQAFDRGREEVVRRSIEMITTRGSVYTVFVVGQALQVMPQATNVVGSTRLKQTFEIVPQFAFRNLNNGVPEYADDTFNPSQPIRVSRRFSAPTNYTIRVLATSYD